MLGIYIFLTLCLYALCIGVHSMLAFAHLDNDADEVARFRYFLLAPFAPVSTLVWWTCHAVIKAHLAELPQDTKVLVQRLRGRDPSPQDGELAIIESKAIGPGRTRGLKSGD